MLRGSWVDPRDADVAVADWAEGLLSLCRRLAERTQERYRRDLTRFVLPRFGTYRLGHIPADEIENWLNDEIDAGIAPSSVHRHYRTLRRLLQIAVEKQEMATNPCDRVDPPRVPKREMVFIDWDEVLALSDKLVVRHRTRCPDRGMRDRRPGAGIEGPHRVPCRGRRGGAEDRPESNQVRRARRPPDRH